MNRVRLFYIYNKNEEGFLKVKHEPRSSGRKRGFRLLKRNLVFDSWGPTEEEKEESSFKVFDEAEIDDKAYMRQALNDIKIPNLRIEDLVIVPQIENRGGHSPNFCEAFDMQEHFKLLDS